MTGAYAFLGGLLSLAGWVFDVQDLADWFGYGIAIQPNATLCVTFSGLALLALSAGARRAAAACGGIVAAIGGATLFEWISGVSLGIDALFLFEREWGRVGVIRPGRMGPPGSLSWTLIGTALLLATGRESLRRYVPLLGLTTMAISMLSLIGYLYGADKLFALPYSTVIALQTSTFILAVSTGIVASQPDREPMRLLRDPGTAGMFARRALPALLLVPIGLGYLSLLGQHAGLYDVGLGLAMLVLVLVVLLGVSLMGSLTILRAREHSEREVLANLAAARQAEQERRTEMEALVEAAPVAIWVARDRDCRVITGNAAAAAMMRMPDGVNMSKTAPDEDVPRHVEIYRDGALVGGEDLPIQTAARTGRPVPNQHLELRFADGTSNWAYGNAVPLLDDAGQVRGVIGTFVDITRLKEAQGQLRLSDRRKDEFLAILAHELRNPLAPMRNGLQLMKLSPGDAALHERVRPMMERQLEQMVRLIDDLLDASRIRGGKLALRRETGELSDVLKQALDACRPLAEAGRHDVQVSLPPEPVHVHADLVRLAQVFGNLLGNACKFTAPGGHIALTARREGRDVVVSVKDDGIGIPAEAIGGIFEMFAQVDRSLERSRGGLGLGLALVKQLVELHGGTVEARSPGVGHGSEFVVRLPVVVAPPPPPPARESIEPLRRRILVVDDNRDSALSLAALLSVGGNEAHTAYDGQEAVELATRVRPEVVLLDIGLPKLNGYDVCRRLRREPGGEDVVIVALTGWGQESDKRRASEAGFDAHLLKPVEHAELLELLASIGADPRSRARREQVQGS